MKILRYILLFFVPIFSFAQVNDAFSDGNFTENPAWTGTTTNFIVNASLQLQSNATTTSTSFIFTPSEAFDDATWECWVKITYPTSSSNYAAIYLVSDRVDITNCYGYYVQIGGTNDEVSLFVQEGTKKTKIIDGADKRTDGNTVEIRIKVTRDAQGNFSLFSKTSTETEFVLEGTTLNNAVKKSSYVGLVFANTSTTGSSYYFDDVLVTGNKAVDLEKPRWISFSMEQPNRLHLGFSEAMDVSTAHFQLQPEIGALSSIETSEDKTSIKLSFNGNFERGTIYTLRISDLSDLAGNTLDSVAQIGISESISETDLILNEVMFENPDNSVEYVEIYNKSDKVLDISETLLTTRKTDGSLNTGIRFPDKTLLMPFGYLALCSDPNALRNYHNCPFGSNILASSTWSTLNNESTTLVLCNAEKDIIYDELTYNKKWHHILVKNPKGVALERINPDLPTQESSSWHSASSETNYGTPGYKNSQYRDIAPENITEKIVWLEPEAFSPDNDGVDDVCFIRYKTDNEGYVANINIFSATGIKVYQLAANALLSAEGFFTWDGRTDRGQIANVGIYVLYFEIINPQTGMKKQEKLPIVLSSR